MTPPNLADLFVSPGYHSREPFPDDIWLITEIKHNSGLECYEVILSTREPAFNPDIKYQFEPGTVTASLSLYYGEGSWDCAGGQHRVSPRLKNILLFCCQQAKGCKNLRSRWYSFRHPLISDIFRKTINGMGEQDAFCTIDYDTSVKSILWERERISVQSNVKST